MQSKSICKCNYCTCQRLVLRCFETKYTYINVVFVLLSDAIKTTPLKLRQTRRDHQWRTRNCITWPAVCRLIILASSGPASEWSIFSSPHRVYDPCHHEGLVANPCPRCWRFRWCWWHPPIEKCGWFQAKRVMNQNGIHNDLHCSLKCVIEIGFVDR